VFGTATLEHLRSEVSAAAAPAWGEWLVANYYRNGAAESLVQKAEHLGERNPFGLNGGPGR
jgi:hypothetical protein